MGEGSDDDFEVTQFDRKVFTEYPQPVALAWRRIFAEREVAARIDHLFSGWAESLARCLAASFLADYTLDATTEAQVLPALECALNSKSLGAWFHLVRALIVANHARPGVDAFFANAHPWYFVRGTRPSSYAKDITSLIERRNAVSHGSQVAQDLVQDAQLGRDLALARGILRSLDWWAAYRLFDAETERLGADGVTHGRARLFVGASGPVFAPATWTARLNRGGVYVQHPADRGVLDASPSAPRLREPRGRSNPRRRLRQGGRRRVDRVVVLAARAPPRRIGRGLRVPSEVVARGTAEKTDEELLLELQRLVARFEIFGTDADVVAWNARKCAEVLLLIKCRNEGAAIPKGAEDRFDELKKAAALSKPQLGAFQYMQMQGNAAAHAQRTIADAKIDEPFVVIEMLRTCVGHVLVSCGERRSSKDALDKCAVALTTTVERFRMGTIDSASSLRRQLDTADRIRIEMQAELDRARSTAATERERRLELEERLTQLTLPAFQGVPVHRPFANAEENSDRPDTQQGVPVDDASKTRAPNRNRRRIGRGALAVLTVLVATALVVWVVRARQPPRPDMSAATSSGTSVSDALASGAASAPDPSVSSGVSAENPDASATPATLASLRIPGGGGSSWHVDLPSPLRREAMGEDAQEVSTAEGVVIRLYACRKETWLEHRDRPGFKVSHKDALSFTLNGVDRNRLFIETCMVGMKGPHICLRVLYQNGQEAVGEAWLRRLGNPVKDG